MAAVNHDCSEAYNFLVESWVPALSFKNVVQEIAMMLGVVECCRGLLRSLVFTLRCAATIPQHMREIYLGVARWTRVRFANDVHVLHGGCG